MYRLSLVINEIYNKYLPLATKAGISLNLDFPDSTMKVKNPEKLKKALDENLDSALKRTIKGEVSLNVFSDRIEIRDSGTVLSAPAKALLEMNEHIKVSSRVGFGTKVTILF
ncbi:HAMP domain-containing histidine kinase [Candidatus Saccharibacteria bacterium]|nr:HAMP domain-containing histidine kinase [Candidatus Saccharibacteria bacterium]